MRFLRNGEVTCRSHGWPAVFCACLVTACGPADRPDGGPTVVRDSAGIAIVENADIGWAAGEAWQLSTEPRVEIGVQEGDPAYQLFRASASVRLSDDRIVVANSGTSELRFYDPAGRFLFASGREGEGPGEFRDVQALWRLHGDTLLAYDFPLQRLSLFAPAGEFVRAVTVEPPGGRQPFVRGPFGDGSLLVSGSPLVAPPGSSSDVVRDSVEYYRYGPGGAPIDTLGRFPFAEFYRWVGDGDFRLTSPPFARFAVAAVSGDRFYFGGGGHWELEVYTRTGSLERIIRVDRALRRVTEADAERFRETQLERAGREGVRSLMARMLAEMPVPETMPAYRALRVDTEGNLWVEHYRPRWEEEPRWTVFAPDGSLRGTMMMPARFDVHHIGADFVLGVWQDGLGVEHVRLYDLVKP